MTIKTSTILGKLYRKRLKSVFRTIFVFILISLFFAAAVAAVIIGKNELQKLSSNFVISIALKPNADSLNEKAIKSIKEKSWVKSAKVTTPERAKQEFSMYYGNISAELLPENPFPTVIDLKIKESFQDSETFEQIIKYYKKMDRIDEIQYRKDFVETLFKINKQGKIVAYSLGILFILIIIFLIYLSARTDFTFYIGEFEDFNDKEPSNSRFKFATFIFNIINGYIGIIFGSVAAYGLYYLFIKNNNLTVYNILLAGFKLETLYFSAALSAVLGLIIILFTCLVVKARKEIIEPSVIMQESTDETI